MHFIIKIYNYIIYLFSSNENNSLKFIFKSKNKKIIKRDIKKKYNFTGNLLNLYCNNKKYAINKWHHYIPLYDKFFKQFVGTKVKLLEIGVKKRGKLETLEKVFWETGSNLWNRH